MSAKEKHIPEWQSMDNLREYVVQLKQKYYSDLSHIEPDNLIYVAFSKKKSSIKANIRPIKGVWSLFKPHAYILAVHLESWDMFSEQERMYVIYHELLHIPEYGFEQESKEYKKLIKHDLQDFKTLVYEFGVYKEKLDTIVKNGDSKSPSKKEQEEIEEESDLLDEDNKKDLIDEENDKSDLIDDDEEFEDE